MSNSRVEELLEQLDSEGKIDYEPQSRVEEALVACINKTGKAGCSCEPQSRIEELLQVHAEQMCNGGGGSAKVSYIGNGNGPVPNTGYIDNIIFNTSVSHDEVLNLLKSLTYYNEEAIDAPVYYILGAKLNISDACVGYVIVNFAEDGYAIMNMVTAELYWVSEVGAPMFEVSSGWQEAAYKPAGVTVEVIQTHNEGFPIGSENDKLVSIVYVANAEIPYEKTLTGVYNGVELNINNNKEIDVITEYLDNQQMPTKVNVNIPSETSVTGELVEYSVLGSAEFNQIRFNTNYTEEELYNLIVNSNLTKYSTSGITEEYRLICLTEISSNRTLYELCILMNANQTPNAFIIVLHNRKNYKTQYLFVSSNSYQVTNQGYTAGWQPGAEKIDLSNEEFRINSNDAANAKNSAKLIDVVKGCKLFSICNVPLSGTYEAINLKITENKKIINIDEYINKNIIPMRIDVAPKAAETLINMIENPTKEKIFTVPYGVTKVADYGLNILTDEIAFEGPELITSVGNYGCQKIGTIKPKSDTELVLPNCTSLGKYAFYGRPFKKIELEKIVEIPDLCFYIGHYSVSGTNSCEINLPICTSIGSDAFGGLVSANSGNKYYVKVSAPECKKLGARAFSYCAIRSEDFYMPKLEEIGQACFNAQASFGESGFIGEFIAPENLSIIGANAFMYNSYLTKVILNSKCKTINNMAFAYDNRRLKKVELNEGLETLGNEIFYGTNAIPYLKIPSTLKTSGYGIYFTQGGIVEFAGTTPPVFSGVPFSSGKISKIYIPTGTSATYKSATNLTSYADIIFEPYTINLNISNELLNNENYQYSLDDGTTYNNFTTNSLQLNSVTVVKIKSSDGNILIGTTEGGNEVGTVQNDELIIAFETDTTVYLTVQ